MWISYFLSHSVTHWWQQPPQAWAELALAAEKPRAGPWRSLHLERAPSRLKLVTNSSKNSV